MDGQKKFPTGIQITAVIFVIVIFAALYYLTKRSPENQPQQQPTNEQQATTIQPASSTKPRGGTSKKSTVPPAEQSLTYDQAIKTYTDKRIQFDPNCFTIPVFSNFMNGTKVMFDNRYEKGRWFYLDGKGYYLEPYGFKIVTLYSKTLPHTIMIDCGTGKNNGQILLQ